MAHCSLIRSIPAVFAPVLLAAIVAAVGCQDSHDSSPTNAATQAPVAPKQLPVTEVRLEVWPQTVRVQGSLLGDERAVVGSKIPGRVERVLVDLGSQVRKGDTLVLLDRYELELHVRQAEAQLRQACASIGIAPEQSELELRREQAPPVLLEKALVDEARAAVARVERLPTRQATSDTELERLYAQLKTAEARYQSALNNVGEEIALIGVRRAELALAQQKLDEAEIAAPFDGIVEQRHVSAGEYVQVGQQTVTLVRTDQLRFTAGVPESKATAIRPGQRILLHLDGGTAPVEAAISRVSPTVTQASRALWIEADVPNSDLRRQAGLFAEAEIVIDPYAKTLTVPSTAIAEFAGIEKVWIVRDGKAEERAVRTGRRQENRIEILEGLDDGDLIAMDSRQGRAGEVIAIRDLPADARSATLPAASAE